MRVVLAELTFRQELWIAFIQAAGVLLGVVFGLAIGIAQARRAVANQQAALKVEHQNQLAALKVEHDNQLAALKFAQEHEAQAERDRLFRNERISLYRRLLQAGYQTTQLTVWDTLDAQLRTEIADAEVAWEGAYAETQLIGRTQSSARLTRSTRWCGSGGASGWSGRS